MVFRREFRPIDEWPWPQTPDNDRQRSRFEASYSDTLDLLDREVDKLDPDVVYLCLDLPDSKILKDRSGPYSTARPEFPGVLVVVEGTDHGTLRYGTDQFHGQWTGQPSWHHNLRAIALGLEALRKVDRYGITRGGQQYRGFAALPAPADDSTHMTRDDAIDLVAARLGKPADDLDLTAGSRDLRAARARSHPDVHDGDQEPWDAMQAALRVLGVPA